MSISQLKLSFVVTKDRKIGIHPLLLASLGDPQPGD